MATDIHAGDKSWQPTIEPEPEFNAFVNPVDRYARLENPPLLETVVGGGDESLARVPVAPPLSESAESSSAAPLEPAERHTMIAQAAYFLSEHRSFSPGDELSDWLAAEIEISRVLHLE